MKPLTRSEHQEKDMTTLIGFWVYVMTDCVLFASLFAVFAVLRSNTAGGPSISQIVDLPYALVETLALLASSFTCGLAILSAQRRSRKGVILFLALTFVLGATFLTMELIEFHGLIIHGESWRRSAMLSAFFTLVGTHGLHITVGLLWIAVMIVSLLQSGLTRGTTRRLALLAIFWHFLDLVWIFIFTFVYLIGGMH
ncbi:MAG: cytochrome o ubiquinol oxidase subunit III [Candidatus Dormibacteria bacterium]